MVKSASLQVCRLAMGECSPELVRSLQSQHERTILRADTGCRTCDSKMKLRNPTSTFLYASSKCIFPDGSPEKDGDGRSRSRLSPENGRSKDEMGEKVGVGRAETDGLD